MGSVGRAVLVLEDGYSLVGKECGARGTAFGEAVFFPVKRLSDLGFEIVATEGTADILQRNGVPARVTRKQFEGVGPGGEPTAVDLINAGEIDLIINTPYGVGPRRDGYEIRTAAVLRGVPCITTCKDWLLQCRESTPFCTTSHV
jgi:hypothetical protein